MGGNIDCPYCQGDGISFAQDGPDDVEEVACECTFIEEEDSEDCAYDHREEYVGYAG